MATAMELSEVLGQLLCVGIAVTLIFFFAFPVGRWLSRLSLGHSADEADADENEELCSKCHYDVRGLKQCPECGTETRSGRRRALQKLRNDWPTESFKPRVPAPGETPVVILNSTEQMALRLLRQHLQARGIRAKTSQVRDRNERIQAKPPAMYRLTVWSGDGERAEAIVKHLWPVEAR